MSSLKSILDRPIRIEDYLLWSTVIAVMMFIHLTGTFQVGYAIVLLNTCILLVLDRIFIHRNHLIAIFGLAAFALVAAQLAGTPLNAPISQLLGIGVMSVYFFNALTKFGISLERWMEMYICIAFWLAVAALILFPLEIPLGQPRLRGIYSEPSYFIYVTLPAVGYCINCFVRERRYGIEALVFLLSFAFADSSLGFLGLLLIAIFTFAPRLRPWQMILGGVFLCLAVAGLYVVSENFRIRATEMTLAIMKQDLSVTGNSTFAVLSNVYVASQSFLAHPLIGVGLGGYANQYDKYLGDLTGGTILANQNLTELESMQLNRDDASSMFLRVAAELGLPGLLLLVAFLIICARVRGPRHIAIRNAILPYLIVRMARMGAYFTVEFYFFVGLYLLNYLNYRGSDQNRDPYGPARQLAGQTI